MKIKIYNTKYGRFSSIRKPNFWEKLKRWLWK